MEDSFPLLSNDSFLHNSTIHAKELSLETDDNLLRVYSKRTHSLLGETEEQVYDISGSCTGKTLNPPFDTVPLLKLTKDEGLIQSTSYSAGELDSVRPDIEELLFEDHFFGCTFAEDDLLFSRTSQDFVSGLCRSCEYPLETYFPCSEFFEERREDVCPTNASQVEELKSNFMDSFSGKSEREETFEGTLPEASLPEVVDGCESTDSGLNNFRVTYCRRKDHDEQVKLKRNQNARGRPPKHDKVFDEPEVKEWVQGRYRRRAHRAYTTTKPSRWCHICNRNVQRVPLYPCANSERSTCRKSICIYCIGEYKDLLSFEERNESVSLETMICTHCNKTCPPKAQCRVYGKTNIRRRAQNLFRQLNVTSKDKGSIPYEGVVITYRNNKYYH